MFDEPSMPPYETVLATALISPPLLDWQAVSEMVLDVCRLTSDTATPRLKKTVAELTAGAKTDMDKIKAVFITWHKRFVYGPDRRKTGLDSSRTTSS